jgi:hypothetical protein
MVRKGVRIVLLLVLAVFFIGFTSAADCNGNPYLNCHGVTNMEQCTYAYPGICIWSGTSCNNVADKYCSDITYRFYCTSEIGCTWSGPVCSSGVCCVEGQIVGSSNSCNTETRFICTDQKIQIQTRSQYCTGDGPDSCGTTWDSWTNQYVYSDCTAYPYSCTEGYSQSSPFGCSDTSLCTDSDGGKNYLLKGTTTVQSDSETDICTLGGSLIEYYCNGNQIGGETYDCSHLGASYICSDGVCVCSHDYACIYWERECGDDGCGGTCGTCSTFPHSNMGCGAIPMATQYLGKCYISSCTGNYGNCDNSITNPNGCETPLGTNTNCASCGNTCENGASCYNYACCTPSCSGKECGSDGCGGSCGSCNPATQICDGSGSCVAKSGTYSCGDGIITQSINEQCDCGSDGICTSAELNSQTCASVLGAGYTGTLKCYASTDPNKCTFDTSSCVAPCSCASDDNECTIDACVLGVCTHNPVTDGTACATDPNECTSDACSAGFCAHPNKASGTTCSSDGNPCTNDVCSSSGTCGTLKAAGTACTADSDVCTTDVCNALGVCSHNDITSCINGDGCCPGASCNGLDNNCVVCSVATQDDDCDDGESCTDNLCISGVCSNPVKSGQCCANSDCNDYNACTTDLCIGTCSNPSINNCCTDASDCSGEDVCSYNQCVAPTGYCDDGDCNNGENCDTCPEDCGSCSVPCGDDYCDAGAGETCDNCEADCGACDYCGNGHCDNGENCATCNTDCGCDGDEQCSSGSCIKLCGNSLINSGEDCDGGNLGGETCTSVLGSEYTGDLGCSGCLFDTSGCYLACKLNSASWSKTMALEGEQVKLNIDGQNCDEQTISFVIMEKDGFLNGDDRVEKDPVSIIYGSPSRYGIWSVEWQDDAEFGQSNPPEYYFTATAEGGATITSSKTDGDMLNTYKEDVECLGINYCANYLSEAECQVDLCNVGTDSAPSSVSCGGTFNPETGCYDYTDCGCTWDSNAKSCGANWQSDSACGICGNHVKDTGEECDDGNLIDGDGCSSICQYEPGIPSPCTEGLTLCSDGTCSLNCDVTDEGVAECDYDGKCDTGEGCTCQDCNSEQDTCKNGLICNIIDSACCSSENDNECNPYCAFVDPDCAPSRCGNGFKELGEECDLGAKNNVSNSGCSSTCKYVILEPPCPEGTNLCNDNTCSLNCFATDEGIKGCGEAGACAVGLQCSAEDKACCRWSPDGFCDSYCAFVDPDCQSSLLEQGLFSIGTCLYTENGKDTCEGDGMLTRSLSAQWNWSAENTFSSNPDGLDYWQPTGSGVFRYDPMDYSGLRKSQNCVYIEDTFACPASAEVSFFGIYQLVIAVAVVALIYLIYALRKKNNSKHVRKHSRIAVRKRRK